MSPRAYTIACEWDDEAGCWYVTDSDVPGLAAEGDTLEGLLDKLKVLIPELLELNGELPQDAPDVAFTVHAQRSTRALHAA